eukprot:Skav218417  [mRNA]  locus=scaffold466:66209:67183:+ [translate_table: standard]
MSTIKREDAMTALKEVMKTLKLDLSVSDAEYMVVIEVNPVLCGFSVLQDYEGDPWGRSVGGAETRTFRSLGDEQVAAVCCGCALLGRVYFYDFVPDYLVKKW